jgi:hypothetical protein
MVENPARRSQRLIEKGGRTSGDALRLELRAPGLERARSRGGSLHDDDARCSHAHIVTGASQRRALFAHHFGGAGAYGDRSSLIGRRADQVGAPVAEVGDSISRRELDWMIRPGAD